MAKAKEQKKNQELAKRARKMTRLIHRKAFTSSDGLFLIDGNPDHEVFVNCLISQNMEPGPTPIPSPIDLGFAPEQVLRVTTHLLADLGKALQKWHKIIREKDARRVRKRDDAERLKRWIVETATYDKRLERLHTLLRETQTSETGWTAYVNLDADTAEADRIIKQVCVGQHLRGNWHWMSQVVFWMAGSAALKRFLAVPEMVSLSEKQRIEAVQRFKSGLLEIETRFNTETRPFRFQDIDSVRNHNKSLGTSHNIKITFQNAEAVKDYIHDLFKKEKQAVAVLEIKPPRRPRDLDEYLFTIGERCNAWLERGFKASSNRRIAEIAALCALDGGTVPIPRYLMDSNAEKRPFFRFIRDLINISTEPGYDSLLVALNEFDPFPGNYSYDVPPDVLRRIVLAGASAEDLNWLLTHDHYTTDGKYRLYSEAFAEAGLNPAPLRLLVEQLKKLGSDCESEEIEHALDLIAQSEDIQPAVAFNAWLAQLTTQRPDPAAARRIWHTFLEALNLKGLGLQYRQTMDQWFSAKPLKDAFAGMINPEMDEQVLRQLGLLARYQHLAGQDIRLTGSLQRLLQAEVRTSAELTYLKKQEAAGSLAEGAKKRLHYLRSREKYEPSVEKVLRKTVEISAITALDGLRHRIDKELSDLWDRFTAEHPMSRPVSQEKRLEILRWAQALDSKHKAGLQEILEAWAEAANRYKMRLDCNREWLEKADSRFGIDVEKWLYPLEQAVSLDGKPVRLAVANDPFQIFLMGSYFDTCVALDKGSNRDTVLSNAYEASKQVLYATDADGVVLARKLVGITPGGDMVGFRTYLASGIDADRDELNSHIHAFCATWAENCGAGLAGVGQPEKTSGLFWYNDGLEGWLPSADALHRERVDNPDTSRKPVRELLEEHWTDCVPILQELGLWPIEDAETPELMFSHRKGLAEELLAEVALDHRDVDLLNQLEDCVSTGGGWLQSLKVRALLDPEQAANTLLQATLNTDDWPYSKMDGKILRLLARCEAEIAFDRLFDAFIDLDGYMHGVLNIVLALQGNPERAQILRQRITHWDFPLYCDNNAILSLLHAAETADGGTFSDHVISRLTYDPKSEHFNMRPALVQWLPALKKPQGLLGDFLHAAWTDPRITEHYSHLEQEVRVNLVVWCLRNPSAPATGFLRKYSDQHPAALLGLALAEPLRYRVQIEKAATEMAPTPAAALAVLVSHGQAAGADFLATLPGYKKKPELVENALEMVKAIDALDWQACAAIPGFSKKKLSHCLPLIMRKIWDSLSEPAGTAGVERLQSIDAARFLQNAGVSMYGLCLNIIAGLHRYDDLVVDRLCLGVRRLFVATGKYGIPGEFRLWLNDLSGDRLFATDAPDLDEYPELLEFEDSQFSDLYPFLFTKNGERRSVCRVPWYSGSGPFVLPLLRQEAPRFAELLVEKLYPQNPRFMEQGCCSTPLEIEKLLIEYFVQKVA
jgi:hypothetical protein